MSTQSHREKTFPQVLKICGKIHKTFTIWSILQWQFSGIKDIHVLQPSLLFISRTLFILQNLNSVLIKR